jgi:hypothetical protein
LTVERRHRSGGLRGNWHCDVDDGADAEGDAVGSGPAHPAAPDKIDKIRMIEPERMGIASPARK